MHSSDDDSKEYPSVLEKAVFENDIALMNQVIHDNMETNDNIELILAKTYEKAKLWNIPLTNEVEISIINQLVNLRFFTERTKENTEDVRVELDDVLERIHRLTKLIERLTRQFTGMSVAKNMFIYLCQLTAKHIHTLKYQLKSTYDKLPWTEMEFCFVALIMNIVKPNEADDVFKLVLHKNRVLEHLNNFKEGLTKLKHELNVNSIGRKMRLGNRIQMTQSVISFMPAFESLYHDYDIIRDVTSLKRIDEYISLCRDLQFADDEESDKLVIERTLQAIGETLKSTPDSPNISEDVQRMLLDSAPKNLEKIITTLRYSLSHTESLSNKVGIEKDNSVEFFKSIRDDLDKVHIEIVDILFKRRLRALEIFAKCVVRCDDLEEIRNLSHSIEDVDFDSITFRDIFLKDLNKVQCLVEELMATIREFTIEENSLFQEISKIIENERNKVLISMKKYERFAKSVNFSISEMRRSNKLNYIKNLFEMILEASQHSGNNDSLVHLSKPLLNIQRSIKTRMSSEYNDQIEMIFNKIFDLVLFKLAALNDITRLKSNLDRTDSNINQHIDSTMKTVETNLKGDNEKIAFRKAVKNKKEIYATRLHLLEEINKKTNTSGRVADEKAICDLMKKLKMKKQNETTFLEGYRNEDYKVCKDIISKVDDPYGLFIKNMSDLDVFSYQKQIKYLKLFLSSLKLKKFPIDNVIDNFNDDCERQIKEFIRKRLNILEKYLKIDTATINGIQVINRIQENATSKAITELILLDIMNILENSSLFVDDKLFLDDFAPLMLGKSLRNYLAHGNVLINMLPFDAGKTIACNAVKILQEYKDIIEKKDILMGKRATGDMFKSKFYLESLDILVMQNLFYSSVQSNIMENVMIALKQGANMWGCDVDCQNGLHFAASTDSLESFIFCNENGLDLNSLDVRGQSPLDVAVQNGSMRIFEYYCTRTNVDLDEILILAAKYDQKDIIVKVLEDCNNDAIPSAKQAISFASQFGFVDIVETLLRKFDDSIDSLRRTDSLFQACFYGHEDVVKLLLACNFDVNATLVNGDSPIHLAITGGHLNIVELLLRHGSKVDCDDTEVADENRVEMTNDRWPSRDSDDARQNSKETVIPPLVLAAMLGHLDILKLLISTGAEINISYEDISTPLAAAATFDHRETVDFLIKSGADVDSAPRDNGTPLHRASEGGHARIVEILLENSAEIGRTTRGHFTAVHVACRKGHEPVLDMLLKHKGDVNAKTIDGRTPLHFAAEMGHKNVVERLLENGADVGICDNEGYSALHLVNRCGDEHVTRTLIQHGGKVNATDIDNNTPLHFAASYGNLKIAEVLIKYGAKIDVVNSIGATPLVYSMESDSSKVAEMLIATGADGNVVYTDTYTALHLACRNGRAHIVKLLIERGAAVDTRDSLRNTSLHIACSYRQCETVKILLENRADINSRNSDGYTPLYVASRNGASDIVVILLENGSDVALSDSQGITPLHVACHSGHRAVVEYLLDKGADLASLDVGGNTPLHVAALNGHTNIARILIEHEADVNARNFSDETPLHMACENGSAVLVELLMENKADMNVTDEECYTPLHVAAHNGHDRIVELLLRSGMSANTSTPAGATPLHMAAEKSNARVIETLAGNGADVNAVMDTGETPLHVSADCGNVDACRALLGLECNKNASDSAGRSALHAAAEKGHHRLVDMLINEAGLSVNALDNRGYTPLRLACASENGEECLLDDVDLEKTVAVLLANGAVVGSEDS